MKLLLLLSLFTCVLTQGVNDSLYWRLNYTGWSLGRKLGEGGFGRVFLIKGPDGKQSALKLCPIFDRNTMDNALIEIMAVSHLSSNTMAANILNTFEGWTETYDAHAHRQFGTWSKYDYKTQRKLPAIPEELLVLRVELCDMDLGKWLRTNPSVEDRWDVLVQILRGLQYIHWKGMIHRDMKPANVLIKIVNGKPIAKVSDFGLAKSGLASGNAGTRRYMPPEQKRGDVHDNKVDMWAFGMIMLETMMGCDAKKYKVDGQQALKFSNLVNVADPKQRKSATQMIQCLKAYINGSGNKPASPARAGGCNAMETAWIIARNPVDYRRYRGPIRGHA